MLRIIIDEGFDAWLGYVGSVFCEIVQFVCDFFLDLSLFGWIMLLFSLCVLVYEWYQFH